MDIREIVWIAVYALAIGLLAITITELKKKSLRKDEEASLISKLKSFQTHELWVGRHQNIPLKFYGGGSNHPFDYYFTRESSVEVSSVNDIVNWLLSCEYVPDHVQFRKRDHWQHPVDFEATRKGDCEDFALWAWRKLVELGHDAEFMVGKWIRGERIGTHAWVLLEHNGTRYLFESTGRTHTRVMRPHVEAMTHYIPFASVDRNMRKKVYNGIAHWILQTR